MKASCKISFAFFSIILTAFMFTGCFEQKKFEFSFPADSIEQIYMYNFSTPSDIQKKVITEKNDIQSIFSTFTSINVNENNLEPVSGADTTSFRFKLTDGTDFEIIYISHAIKSGEIIVNNDFHYKTSADIGALFNNYNYEISEASQSELPLYIQ